MSKLITMTTERQEQLRDLMPRRIDIQLLRTITASMNESQQVEAMDIIPAEQRDSVRLYSSIAVTHNDLPVNSIVFVNPKELIPYNASPVNDNDGNFIGIPAVAGGSQTQQLEESNASDVSEQVYKLNLETITQMAEGAFEIHEKHNELGNEAQSIIWGEIASFFTVTAQRVRDKFKEIHPESFGQKPTYDEVISPIDSFLQPLIESVVPEEEIKIESNQAKDSTKKTRKKTDPNEMKKYYIIEAPQSQWMNVRKHWNTATKKEKHSIIKSSTVLNNLIKTKKIALGKVLHAHTFENIPNQAKDAIFSVYLER